MASDIATASSSIRMESHIFFASDAVGRRIATTPHFVPDRRLRRRVIRAVQQGVDVRVLTPGKNDVPITQWAARALCSGLLRNVVRLDEYQPRVLHAKTMFVDDAWATVGTANFDHRSLFVNAEVNLIAMDGGFCEALATPLPVEHRAGVACVAVVAMVVKSQSMSCQVRPGLEADLLVVERDPLRDGSALFERPRVQPR